MTSYPASPSSSSSSSSPLASSPSSPSSLSFSKLPIPTPLLINWTGDRFHISSHYRILGEVHPEDIASWLLGWCEQQEREHVERLAEADRYLNRSEGLSMENLRAIGSLDLGIDL